MSLDEDTKQKGEEWIREHVKGVNPKERQNFLEECANYLLLFDEYSQNPQNKYQ